MLVIPVSLFTYPSVKHFRPWSRLMVLTALVVAPLLSYAYYTTEKTMLSPSQEIFLSVIPTAIWAVVLFERFQGRAIFALTLAFGVYFNLFVCNDLMGPFRTYFNYASHSPLFYWFRFVSAAISVLTALFFFQKWKSRLENPSGEQSDTASV
jgi:hypothetical protein